MLQPFAHIALLLCFAMPAWPFELSSSVSQTLLRLINNQIQGKLVIEQAEFRFPSHIVLKKPKLVDQQGNIVLAADTVHGMLALRYLFLGRIVFDHATASKLQLFLQIRKGILNIDQAFSPKSSAAFKNNLDLSFQHVDVNEGFLKLESDTNWQVQLQQIDASGDLRFYNQKLHLQLTDLTAKKGHGTISKASFQLEQIQAVQARLKNEIITLQAANGYINGSTVDLHGQLSLIKERYQLDGKILIKEGSWPEGVPPLPFRFPRSESQVRLRGSFDHPILEFDALLGKTEVQGISIERGTAKGKLQRSGILVSEGSLVIAQLGTVFGNAHYDFQADQYTAEVHLEAANLSNVFAFAKVPFHSQGILRATANIKGQNTHEPSTKVLVFGNLQDGHTGSLKLPKDTNLSIEATWQGATNIIHLQRVHVGNQTESLALKGSWQRKGGFNLQGMIKAKNPSLLVDLGNHISLTNLELTGSMQGYSSNWNAKGRLSIQKGILQGIPIEQVQAQVRARPSWLHLEAIQYNAALGKGTGKIHIQNWNHHPLINAQFRAFNLNLATIRQQWLGNFKMGGQVYLSGFAKGHLSNPQVELSFNGRSLSFSQFAIHTLHGTAIHKNQQWTLQNISLQSPFAHITASDLNISTQTRAISGTIKADQIRLHQLPSLFPFPIAGESFGLMALSGNLSHPLLSGTFQLNNVQVAEQMLGKGTLQVWYGKHKDKQWSAICQLNNEGQQSVLRFGYLNEQIALRLESEGLELLPWTQKQSLLIPLSGTLSLSLLAQGHIQHPDINMQVSTSTVKAASIKENIEIGTLQAQLQMKNKQCFGTIFIEEQASMEWSGQCHSLSEYDLSWKARTLFPNLQYLIRSLYEESLFVQVKTSSEGRVWKQPTFDTPLFQSRIQIEELHASMPGVPSATLVSPALVHADSHAVSFLHPVVFDLEDGQLQMRGHLSANNSDFQFEGRMPLLFTKLVFKEVASAEGAVDGSLHFFGSLKYPSFQGNLHFLPGSSIKPKSLLEEIRFLEGNIHFEPTSTSTTRIDVQNLACLIGEGSARLSGNLELYIQKNHPFGLQNANLHLKGNGILLRKEHQWVESDFALTFQAFQNQQWLTGNIHVTDGQFFKRFFLKNFSLSSETLSEPSFALPSWLPPISLNLDLTASSFLASVSAGAFWATAFLTADLNLLGTLLRPKITGTLEVIEGKLQFPSAIFDVSQTNIPFVDNPKKPISPSIQLSAFTELSKRRLPIKADTTVELSVRGDLDVLRLDLRPIAGDKTLDRTKILLLLLGPTTDVQSKEQEQRDPEPQNPVLAISGQLAFLPLTQEIEEWLLKKTQTQVRLQTGITPSGLSTQLQWQLNPRIELQGASVATASSFIMQDLQLKLLLYDHLPLGDMLFLEGVFLSPVDPTVSDHLGNQLKLKYRILQQ